MATISLSNIPDLTASTGAPRIAAIERPEGVQVGMPGDSAGQKAVLTGALNALIDIHSPGGVVNLPMTYVEPALHLSFKPPAPPPIAHHLVRHPWDLPRLLNRQPPK